MRVKVLETNFIEPHLLGENVNFAIHCRSAYFNENIFTIPFMDFHFINSEIVAIQTLSIHDNLIINSSILQTYAIYLPTM